MNWESVLAPAVIATAIAFVGLMAARIYLIARTHVMEKRMNAILSDLAQIKRALGINEGGRP